MDADILVIGRLCGALGYWCFEKLVEWSARFSDSTSLSLRYGFVLLWCWSTYIPIRALGGNVSLTKSMAREINFYLIALT